MSGDARSIQAQPNVRIGLNGGVVKKSHLKFLDEGHAYLEECQRQGKKIVADAHSNAAAVTAKAHEAGYAAGRDNGEKSVLQHGYFRALMLTSVEEQIGGVVKMVVQRLFGELGVDRALFLVAAQAVTDVKTAQTITLKGRADHLEVIERDLAGRLEPLQNGMPGLRVEADSRYPEGEVFADIGSECLKFSLDTVLCALHCAIDDALAQQEHGTDDDDAEQDPA